MTVRRGRVARSPIRNARLTPGMRKRGGCFGDAALASDDCDGSWSRYAKSPSSGIVSSRDEEGELRCLEEVLGERKEPPEILELYAEVIGAVEVKGRQESSQ